MPTIAAEATRIADDAARERLTHRAFLAEVLAAEVDERANRRRARRLHEARFPRMKRLEDFDCTVTPGVPPTTVAALQAGAFIDAGHPVVLLGDSGTGKSHLLIGLGVAACESGCRVRYATTAALVNELVEAAGERILSRAVARYGRYDLLCLDELGYLHLDSRGAELLLAGPDRTRRESLHRGCLQRAVPASGAKPSPIPAWPPRSWTGWPSTPSSWRPAASPTACAPLTPARTESPRPSSPCQSPATDRPTVTPRSGATSDEQGGATSR